MTTAYDPHADWRREDREAAVSTERLVLLDWINQLVMFDETGDDTDTAMAYMRRYLVTAVELNARRASTRRPIYRRVSSFYGPVPAWPTPELLVPYAR